MFGIGKLLGSVAGGVLDKIGLGKLAPFVKMGLNAFTGNWLGVAKDVFSLVSNFKNNPQENAAKQPPLGGFGNDSSAFGGQGSPLNTNRLGNLFKELTGLFDSLKSLGGGDMSGFGKIFNAFKMLGESFNNSQLFASRVSISQFSNIQA